MKLHGYVLAGVFAFNSRPLLTQIGPFSLVERCNVARQQISDTYARQYPAGQYESRYADMFNKLLCIEINP